jgi:hypothetical protein
MLRRVALVGTNFSRGGGEIKFLRSFRRLLITANIVPSSLILVTLMMEALSSSETLDFKRSTRRNIPEDGILHGSAIEKFA